MIIYEQLIFIYFIVYKKNTTKLKLFINYFLFLQFNYHYFIFFYNYLIFNVQTEIICEKKNIWTYLVYNYIYYIYLLKFFNRMQYVKYII